jgi:F-type H+-transporting ATPase subunit b
MHIDWWTLALQTVNVLVLIWILSRFFFRPVANILAKRQEETGKRLADADAARKEAANLRAAADKERTDIARDRDRLIAEARDAALAEKANLLAQAANDIAKLRSEAEAAIARERTTAEHQIIAHASDLSIDIAKRLLARLSAGVSFTEFVDEACRELHALAPDVRSSFAAAPINVVTAAPLTAEQTDQIRKAFREALGQESALTFSTNPAVIAGLELHGRNTIVRNSWQADLERIRADLDRGKDNALA